MIAKNIRKHASTITAWIALLLVLPSVTRAVDYREAPMLRAQVEAGQLPPLDQRLPAAPMVVRPYQRVGVYGGRMRVITGEMHRLVECQYLLMAPLLRFSADGRTIVPNVARHWEMSDDGRVFTIYLRRGMKWSDGAAVTTRDVQFAWEDVLLQSAQSVQVVASYPWIMWPGAFVIFLVLVFNFIGDGLRDAADPYH